MNFLAYLRSLAAKFFHHSQTENDTEEELRAHIHHRADDLARSGLNRAEAERRAAMVFSRWLLLIRGLVGSQHVPFSPTAETAVGQVLEVRLGGEIVPGGDLVEPRPLHPVGKRKEPGEHHEAADDRHV